MVMTADDIKIWGKINEIDIDISDEFLTNVGVVVIKEYDDGLRFINLGARYVYNFDWILYLHISKTVNSICCDAPQILATLFNDGRWIDAITLVVRLNNGDNPLSLNTRMILSTSNVDRYQGKEIVNRFVKFNNIGAVRAMVLKLIHFYDGLYRK